MGGLGVAAIMIQTWTDGGIRKLFLRMSHLAETEGWSKGKPLEAQSGQGGATAQVRTTADTAVSSPVPHTYRCIWWGRGNIGGFYSLFIIWMYIYMKTFPYSQISMQRNMYKDQCGSNVYNSRNLLIIETKNNNRIYQYAFTTGKHFKRHRKHTFIDLERCTLLGEISRPQRTYTGWFHALSTK